MGFYDFGWSGDYAAAVKRDFDRDAKLRFGDLDGWQFALECAWEIEKLRFMVTDLKCHIQDISREARKTEETTC